MVERSKVQRKEDASSKLSGRAPLISGMLAQRKSLGTDFPEWEPLHDTFSTPASNRRAEKQLNDLFGVPMRVKHMWFISAEQEFSPRPKQKTLE